MRKINFTILFCFVALLCSAQRAFTLEQCIEIALENNRNIRQQQLNNQSREIAYNQARADLLPSVSGSAGQSFNFGRSIGLDNTYQNTNSQQTRFGLNSDVTIFDGLRLKRNIDARRADVYASQADLEKLQEDIIISVSSAFLQVLLTKELLQIAENQLETTKENIAQRTQLVQEGRLAQGELLEFEAQCAREEMNRIQAQNNMKLALLDLAQIMELDNFQNFNVYAPTVEEMINESVLLSSTAIFESALVNRPEIRGAQFRMQSREQELLMARSGHYPTLSIGASMGTGYYNMSGRPNEGFSSQFRNNMSNSIGLNVRIPIFNRFQTRSNINNAALAVESSRIAIDIAKNELRKRIEQAYYNAVGAQSRWAASKVSEAASREAYRFAEQKFESGRSNSFELSMAKNNLAQVLAEQAQAKYEYAFRLKILELMKN